MVRFRAVLTLDAHSSPHKARQSLEWVCLLHELVARMARKAQLEKRDCPEAIPSC